MNKNISDLINYVKYYFFEVTVHNTSSLPYKIWAIKRLIKVLVKGRKKSESYLYPKDVIVENSFGSFFVPKNSDFVLTISSKAEKNLIEYFRIANGKTFLDIGANAGKWSIHIAKSFYENRVLAFEPIPSTFSVLKKNISLNSLDKQVRIFNIGLSNQTSLIEFIEHSAFTGINGVYSSSTDLPTGSKIIKVPVHPLDKIITENNVDISSIDLVKIDVEGHEFAVIQGGLSTFKEMHSNTRLLIEIHPASHLKENTVRLLKETGFEIVKQLDSENYLFIKMNS